MMKRNYRDETYPNLSPEDEKYAEMLLLLSGIYFGNEYYIHACLMYSKSECSSELAEFVWYKETTDIWNTGRIEIRRPCKNHFQQYLAEGWEIL